MQGYSSNIVMLLQQGVAYYNTGQLAEAEQCYRKVLTIQPDNADAYQLLGLIAQSCGNDQKAMELMQHSLSLNPKQASVLCNLGSLFHKLGQYKEALRLLKKAEKLSPKLSIAQHGLGLICKEQGQFKKAAQHFRKSLTFQPDETNSFRELTRIFPPEDYPELVTKMKTLHGSSKLSEDKAMHLAYALGHVYEQQKEYEKAFSFFSEGNDRVRKTLPFNLNEEQRLIENLKAGWTTEKISQFPVVEENSDDITPIFILGMPRSGTTLVEQILSSHSDVSAAGEQDWLAKLVLPFLDPETLTAEIMAQQRHSYLVHLQDFSEGTKYVTDKMPSNFLYIGLIKCLFPSAIIIHTMRNPMDNCLSMFTTYFAHSVGYSYNQEELGKYYLLYHDLMQHWHKTLPEFVHDVQYEELVNNHETEVRRLLKICNLEWEDACLDFHKNKRTIRTASAAQATEPIYTSSIAKWKRYEKELTLLHEILAPILTK